MLFKTEYLLIIYSSFYFRLVQTSGRVFPILVFYYSEGMVGGEGGKEIYLSDSAN